MIGVDHLDVVVEDDVARMDRARPLLVQRQDGFLPRVHPHLQTLEVQQDLGDVLLHAFDGRVLVEYAIDLHLRNRAAGHGRQQDTA